MARVVNWSGIVNQDLSYIGGYYPLRLRTYIKYTCRERVMRLGRIKLTFLLSLLLLQGCGGGEANHLALSQVALGDFLFEIDSNQLSIRHSREGAPILWRSPADGRLLSAGSTVLGVKDQRSSYSVTERVSKVCRLPEIQGVDQQEVSIAFFGVFLDCDDATFELRFDLHLTQLKFALDTNVPEFNHLTLQYETSKSERFYGFGEQYSFVNLKGQNIPVLTQEQGVGRGEPLLSTLVNLFSPGSSGNPLTSYYSIPQYISNMHRSLFLENTEYSRFDLRQDERVTVHLFGDRMSGQILQGESMLDLIEGFTDYSGRMPALPDWANRGAIIGLQGGTEKVTKVWHQLYNSGAPISALWLQDWVGKRVTLGGAGSQLWWNWELDEDRYPGWDEMLEELDQEGVRVLGYVNPFLVDAEAKGNVKRNLYQEALALGYLVEKEDGSPFPIEITDFDAGIVDLTHPDARRWMKDVIIDQMIGVGLSGWMADFGEALPFDSVLFDGSEGQEFHNIYPVEWAKINAEAIAEVGLTGEALFFMRSGFTTSPSFSSAFWLGDQAVTWDHYDGIKSSVIGLLNGGMSGLAINHSDIGGYTSLTFQGVGLKRSEELLMRWMEVNAFTAMFRSHEGLAPDSSVQIYSNEKTMSQFSTFARVYAELSVYRDRLFDEATKKGYPLVRHPMLHFEDDLYFQSMSKNNLHYMLGSDLIVAPVLDMGATTVEIHLPEGRWKNFWNPSEGFDIPRGGDTFIVNAPIGKPAVFFIEESRVVQQAALKLKRER
ncbi:hypothetical protein A9Q99_00715 [Gammaproteobacteria bacterium 45_16_T64]|nr:hypothetical protein A9Q99_00715 [Gammaproteobacteria bacterium 45_16_T64]